jgi:hypothetical protein
MKQIFTLLICCTSLTASRAQVVLNELYAIPGSGKHEFFELYNNGVSFSSISMQGYTMVTYFDGAGTEKGFYVMDLPDLTIPPKGYLVGSAARPFNYQGVNGSSKTSFSWNDMAFLVTNGGYLKKWVVGNSVPAGLDGNAQYDEKPIPANFNDFLCRRSAGGASYVVFIYRYGILINAFFGGTSSETVPAFITSMPRLNVRMVSGGQFSINFPAYSSIPAEFVTAEAGSDNGYIRTRDGLCGGWVKSSSTFQHTPQQANGSEPGAMGSVVISAMIERGATAADSSIVKYKLVSAPASVLPVTLDVYVDNGTLPNDLDAGDFYLSSKTLTSAGTTLYQTKFMPYDANLLIAAKTAAGCFDVVLMVTSHTYLLPVKLMNFTGTVDNNIATLQWQVADNSKGAIFEVQRSVEGDNFTTVGKLLSTAENGVQSYSIKTLSEGFYRLKIINHDGSVSFSKVIQLSAKASHGIMLKNNPVDTYLGFTYNSATGNSAEVSIYSMSGVKLYSANLSLRKGANNITLNLGGIIYSGTYVLEIKNAGQRAVTKIYKR